MTLQVCVVHAHSLQQLSLQNDLTLLASVLQASVSPRQSAERPREHRQTRYWLRADVDDDDDAFDGRESPTEDSLPVLVH